LTDWKCHKRCWSIW